VGSILIHIVTVEINGNWLGIIGKIPNYGGFLAIFPENQLKNMSNS
jgi:hypothetical protein